MPFSRLRSFGSINQEQGFRSSFSCSSWLRTGLQSLGQLGIRICVLRIHVHTYIHVLFVAPDRAPKLRTAKHLAHTYTCTCAYAYIIQRIYVCMYAHTYIHIYIHTHTPTHKHGERETDRKRERCMYVYTYITISGQSPGVSGK